jgi:exopolyphosphatase/guanosine-5'-triphosphate,3'-diphosphate pyrophosphatase
MRIAVLDVGSNSAHLKIVDLLTGEPPLPVRTVKRPTRLAEAIDRQGAIGIEAVDRLAEAVAETAATTENHQVDKLIAFATSAVRDAANREEILARVRAASGLELGFISGADEARLTFLAARRWHGWSAGQLLLLDIGGGSLEIAAGDGSEPRVALSAPLGAGRLTREHLPGDPPRARYVRRLRGHVREVLCDIAKEMDDQPSPVLAVATSKTFAQLARLARAPKDKGKSKSKGKAMSNHGDGTGVYVRRRLERKRLEKWIPRLADMDTSRRAKLRGVAKSRARQILAGAIVAEATMRTLGLEHVDICPWALREGILLCELDAQGGSTLRSDVIIYAGGTRPGASRLYTVADVGA